MTLSAGTKLGPYEILSPLGAGGTVRYILRMIVILRVVDFQDPLVVGVTAHLDHRLRDLRLSACSTRQICG